MSAPRPLWEDVRPPLKWAGGKRWLVPELYALWSRENEPRLVEPFCGGLAVALGLRPAEALLNDVNPHPVNFYRHLQKGLKTRVAMRNEEALYYQHRDEFNRLVSSGRTFTRKSAELFYYLNKTGYNGLCRFNSRGGFNVPFGRHRTITYVRNFEAYCAAFAPWTFSHGDFTTVALRPGDFLYADPPYDVQFHHYAKDGFDWDEQERLAHWLVTHDGPVALSNQATDRIVELYGDLGFRLRYLNGPRNISRTGDRSPAPEVLATMHLPG